MYPDGLRMEDASALACPLARLDRIELVDPDEAAPTEQRRVRRVDTPGATFRLHVRKVRIAQMLELALSRCRNSTA